MYNPHASKAVCFTDSVLGRLQAVSILHEIPRERTQKSERATRASGEATSRGDAGRLAATQLTLALFFAFLWADFQTKGRLLAVQFWVLLDGSNCLLSGSFWYIQDDAWYITL